LKIPEAEAQGDFFWEKEQGERERGFTYHVVTATTTAIVLSIPRSV